MIPGLFRCFAASLIFAPVAAVLAAEPAAMVRLSAGIAKADITPDPRMFNWTVPNSPPYGAVHDPLFARVLVLSDGDVRIALVVWDLLDAREFAVARLRTAITRATGIPEDRIIVSATHNHSGPKSELGPGPELAREERTSRPAQNGPAYREWADRLVQTCVGLVQRAAASAQPVELWIARAHVGEWLFNRRPIRPDQSVVSMLHPRDPHALGDGLRFGVVDPTMTVLSLRTPGGKGVGTLFHLSMHAVAVYGAYKGISADWPGRVAELLHERLGHESLFLQGCAGDIVPARRGFEAVEAMSALIAGRAIGAEKVAAKIVPGKIRVGRARLSLPALPFAARALGRASLEAEITVVTTGPLALVTLPGEPLQELGTAIQNRSPFPHTVVLGYANGRGVGYVGLPGAKARGGYEMTEVGAGTDEAGGFLVETALRLLRDQAASARGLESADP